MNLCVAAALGLLVTTTACDDLTFGSSVGGVRESAPAVAGSVKAVGLVLQRSAPGGGRLVEAQLLLVDPGAPDRTVPVGDLKLLIGGESLTLFAVAPNFYQSASTPDFGNLAAGTSVTLSLVAALPSGARTLSASMQLPAQPTLRLPAVAETPGTGRETTIELTGAGEGALAIVSPANGWGARVSYDLLTVAGAGTLPSERIDRWWLAASAFTGPDESLPADAFPASGDYWVEVIALDPVAGADATDAGWASGSWFAAGSATGLPLEAP